MSITQADCFIASNAHDGVHRMRKWLVPLSVTCGIFLVGGVICLVATSLGLFRFAESLPTPAPTPVLIAGRSYWVNALISPIGLPAGLVIPYADVYNKPGSPIADPSITIVAVVPDATELYLTAVEGDWCYVEGTYLPLRQTGTTDYSLPVSGWMSCSRLLDYEPTPYPTPNPTPQVP